MLSEHNIKVSEITLILAATFPYSWKFALSPAIKNFILKFQDSKFNIIKIISLVLQIFIVICFSSIGYLVNAGYIFIVGLLVFILSISIALYDTVYSHVNLVSFRTEELGAATSVISAGFRLGIFISGGVMLYVAEAIGWEKSFLATGIFIALCLIATAFIPRISNGQQPTIPDKLFSLKDYVLTFKEFFKKHNIIIFTLLLLSLKFADGCISTMKPIFLQTHGISKIIFANITHILGMFVTIISGFLAGYWIGKMGITKCLRHALIMQLCATIPFILLPFKMPGTIILAIIINLATFTFGFTNVVYRTFAAQESNRDVNRFALILSIGSLIRIFSAYIGGVVVDHYSWATMFVICLIANIPGLFIYAKTIKNNNTNT
jgi:PAT family beta-lactamase induction signal transducer AmpG